MSLIFAGTDPVLMRLAIHWYLDRCSVGRSIGRPHWPQVVDLRMVYYSAYWSDHSDHFPSGEMVSDDDGPLCHRIWRGSLFVAGAHVSG